MGCWAVLAYEKEKMACPREEEKVMGQEQKVASLELVMMVCDVSAGGSR